MSDELRAKRLLDDLTALSTELADLILTAAATRSTVPTVADYIATIAPTFGPGTAATYGPYWRLTATHLGGRRLLDVTVVDLQAVVADAAPQAKRRRPTSSGRSCQETCVGALRALFARARAAGLISADPAALLTKPRRCPGFGGVLRPAVGIVIDNDNCRLARQPEAVLDRILLLAVCGNEVLEAADAMLSVSDIHLAAESDRELPRRGRLVLPTWSRSELGIPRRLAGAPTHVSDLAFTAAELAQFATLRGVAEARLDGCEG